LSPLIRYVFRRLGLTALTLVGVAVAVFGLMRILPSNPAVLRAGPLASEELVARFEIEMGLDQPIYIQFFDYATDYVRDLATAGALTACVEELAKRLPATLELAATAFVLAMLLGLTLGVLAAVYAGTWLDRAIRVFSTLGASLALFWLALVGIHVFYFSLRLAPPPVDRLTIGLTPPPSVTGLYIRTACWREIWRRLPTRWVAWAPAHLALVVSPSNHARRHADPQRRLRARRAP
jgi:peptide/nickel transport system permease protein